MGDWPLLERRGSPSDPVSHRQMAPLPTKICGGEVGPSGAAVRSLPQEILHRVPWLHRKRAAVAPNPAPAVGFWVETKGKEKKDLSFLLELGRTPWYTVLVTLLLRPGQRDAFRRPQRQTEPSPTSQDCTGRSMERTENAGADLTPTVASTVERHDVPS